MDDKPEPNWPQPGDRAVIAGVVEKNPVAYMSPGVVRLRFHSGHFGYVPVYERYLTRPSEDFGDFIERLEARNDMLRAELRAVFAAATDGDALGMRSSEILAAMHSARRRARRQWKKTEGA